MPYYNMSCIINSYIIFSLSFVVEARKDLDEGLQ